MTATPPASLARRSWSFSAIVVARRLLDLLADLLLPPLDGLLVPGAADDRRVLPVDHDSLGATELIQLQMLELDAQFLGDDLAPGQYADVGEHLLAPISEAGGLDRHAAEGAAQLVHDQRGQGLAIDVLGDDEQRLARARHLLQERQQVLHDADLPVRQQQPDVLEHDLHLLGVGDEVGREIAAVELEPLDHLELRLRRLRLLDGDDALVADLLHGVGHQVADRRVVVGGDRGDLRLLQTALDRPRLLAEGLHHPARTAIEPVLEIDGAGPGHHVAQALAEDGVGQHGGRAGAVTDGFPGALGSLTDHLGAEVLGGVLQLHLLRDGHAVVADDGHAEALLDEDTLGLRPQGHANGVGQRRHPAQDLLASVHPEQHLLVRHRLPPRRCPGHRATGLPGESGARSVPRAERARVVDFRDRASRPVGPKLPCGASSPRCAGSGGVRRQAQRRLAQALDRPVRLLLWSLSRIHPRGRRDR